MTKSAFAMSNAPGANGAETLATRLRRERKVPFFVAFSVRQVEQRLKRAEESLPALRTAPAFPDKTRTKE